MESTMLTAIANVGPSIVIGNGKDDTQDPIFRLIDEHRQAVKNVTRALDHQTRLSVWSHPNSEMSAAAQRRAKESIAHEQNLARELCACPALTAQGVCAALSYMHELVVEGWD
jgi:hypothetical protein